MGKPIKIADSELVIMKALWKHGPLSTNRVITLLSKRQQWNPQTIRTLLKRLSEKGALGVKKAGRQFEYTPLVTQEQLLKQERKNFVNRFYDGTVGTMLASFIEENTLSNDDLERLQSILDEGKDKRDGTKRPR